MAGGICSFLTAHLTLQETEMRALNVLQPHKAGGDYQNMRKMLKKSARLIDVALANQGRFVPVSSPTMHP